jgi:hypothetical protein
VQEGSTRITEPLLSDANDRYIAEMNVDPVLGIIRFRLVTGRPGNDEIVLTLRNVAYLSTACNPEDIEELGSLAFIGDLALYSVSDGGAAILSKLNYPILDLDGKTRAYPGTLRFYMHIEGDICTDVVCGDYSVSHSLDSRQTKGIP